MTQSDWRTLLKARRELPRKQFRKELHKVYRYLVLAGIKEQIRRQMGITKPTSYWQPDNNSAA